MTNAASALDQWWENLPQSTVVEDLRTQEDAETVSMRELHELMEYLLERTDTVPDCARDMLPEPALSLAPVREVLRHMMQVTARINPVQLLTPDQVAQEKALYLEAHRKGHLYSPQFTYRNAMRELHEALHDVPGLPAIRRWEHLEKIMHGFHEAITSLSSVEHPLMRVLLPMLHAKIADDMAAIGLARALEEENDSNIAASLRGLYTAPSMQDLAAAQALAEVLRHHPEMLPWQREVSLPADHAAAALVVPDAASAADLRKFIEASLEIYYARTSADWPEELPGGLRYLVELSSAFVNFDVRDKSSGGPLIAIPDRPRTWLGVLALVRHEIDTHVRQSLNGALLYGFGGGFLKHNQEDLYEGMAMYAERMCTGDLLGVTQAPALPYANIAYDMAASGFSFGETAAHLITLFPASLDQEDLVEKAWNITYRIYRGRLDTGSGLAYGCAKDTGYLRGAIITRQLHAAGLSHLLDMGVMPVHMLPLHRRLMQDLPIPYPDLNTAQTLFKKHFPALSHLLA